MLPTLYCPPLSANPCTYVAALPSSILRRKPLDRNETKSVRSSDVPTLDDKRPVISEPRQYDSVTMVAEPSFDPPIKEKRADDEFPKPNDRTLSDEMPGGSVGALVVDVAI